MKILLDKIFLSVFGIFLIIFGSFSTIIVGLILLAGQEILVWSLLGLVVGIFPLGMGLNFLQKVSRHSLNSAIYNPNLIDITPIDKNERITTRNYQISKPKNQDEHLHNIFYELLESKNGLITVLNFASRARISGKNADKFLKEKVREFNHRVITGPDGEIAYKFEYLTESEISFLSED